MLFSQKLFFRKKFYNSGRQKSPKLKATKSERTLPVDYDSKLRNF